VSPVLAAAPFTTGLKFCPVARRLDPPEFKRRTDPKLVRAVRTDGYPITEAGPRQASLMARLLTLLWLFSASQSAHSAVTAESSRAEFAGPVKRE
jgi:hypothetical protein